MTQPTTYDPSVDFQEEETDNVAGRSTVRTSALDAELQAIALSIGQLISNLGLIQRDDGLLRDQSVDTFNLTSAVLTLIGSAGFTVHNPAGWLTATAYPARDIVTQGTATYVSSVAHTSGVFATDLAAGKWVKLFDSAAFAASSVTFTPTGGVASANVQAAIAEVDTEKVAKASNGSDFANISTTRDNLSVPSRDGLQKQTYTYFADSGSADALVVAMLPLPAAYTSGLQCQVKKSAVANGTTAPTLDAGNGAKIIFKAGGLPVAIGDMAANGHYHFEYDSTYNAAAGGWELLNPTFTATPIDLSLYNHSNLGGL